MRRFLPGWRPVPGLIVLLSAACVDEAPPTAFEPQLRSLSPAALTVRVREPGGAPVCDSLPAGTRFIVGFAAAPAGSDSVVVEITCPAWQAVLPLQAPVDGELFARIAGGSFPYLQIGPLKTVAGDTVFAFRMKHGRTLNGGARLDGVPFAGEDLVRFSGFGQVVAQGAGGSASSDAAGAWIDPVTRQPFRLQGGVDYARRCVPGPGMRLGSGPDPGDIDPFPAGFGAVQCLFRTSNAVRWTHRTNDLQLTPGAGRIDATLGDDVSGRAFPVAFPTGGSLVFGRSLIRDGALVLAVDGLGAPWTPWQRADLTRCDDGNPAVCPMYETTAGPLVARSGGRLRVRWEMADTGNGSARFTVTQHSYDGAYGDYVLFRVAIRNDTDQDRTVHPAWYLDWNLGPVAGTDMGGPSFGGRVLWATDGDRYLGSWIAGHHPVVARWVGQCCGIGQTPAAAEDILRGFAVTTAPRGPWDVTTVHGTRLLVPAHSTRAFWFAILAGGSLAELEDNAAFAQDEVDVRRAGGTP